MEKLQKELNQLIDTLGNSSEFRGELDDLISVFPFSEYEYIISTLLGKHRLQYEEYLDLRNSYIDRNLYLYIFEISAPRGFGDKWAFGHLKELVPEFQRPKGIDPDYSNEYDLLLEWQAEFIKVEVKASRAVDSGRPDEPLYIKALPSDSERPFDMNFQQIKPKCADVFIWIAVWRDKIRYWVLASHEVKNSRYFSKGQHRGNVGEGQLHLKRDNISNFEEYEVRSTTIKEATLAAYVRQKKYDFTIEEE